MAKEVSFQFKGLEKLSKNLVETFNLIIQQHKLIDEVADTIINDIKYQTRRGYGPDGSKLKPLSTTKHPFLYSIYGQLDLASTSQKTFSTNTSWVSLVGEAISKRQSINKVLKRRNRNTLSARKRAAKKSDAAKASQVRDGYSWIDIREAISNSQPTHKAFKKDRSNLTLSGQLLDSIKYKSTDKGKIKFYFDGQHEPYKVKNSNGKIIKTCKAMPNSDLATYVEEQGRPFFGIRPQIEKRVIRIIIASIRRNYKLVSKLRS